MAACDTLTSWMVLATPRMSDPVSQDRVARFAGSDWACAPARRSLHAWMVFVTAGIQDSGPRTRGPYDRGARGGWPSSLASGTAGRVHAAPTIGVCVDGAHHHRHPAHRAAYTRPLRSRCAWMVALIVGIRHSGPRARGPYDWCGRRWRPPSSASGTPFRVHAAPTIAACVDGAHDRWLPAPRAAYPRPLRSPPPLAMKTS